MSNALANQLDEQIAQMDAPPLAEGIYPAIVLELSVNVNPDKGTFTFGAPVAIWNSVGEPDWTDESGCMKQYMWVWGGYVKDDTDLYAAKDDPDFYRQLLNGEIAYEIGGIFTGFVRSLGMLQYLKDHPSLTTVTDFIHRPFEVKVKHTTRETANGETIPSLDVRPHYNRSNPASMKEKVHTNMVFDAFEWGVSLREILPDAFEDKPDDALAALGGLS